MSRLGFLLPEETSQKVMEVVRNSDLDPFTTVVTSINAMHKFIMETVKEK